MTDLVTSGVQAPAKEGLHDASVIRRSVVAVGLLGIAAIHLADLPGKLQEVPYLGAMYIALIVGCVALAELVARSAHRVVYAAAAGLAASTIVGFVLTRTIGLPNAVDDIGNWSEPLGLVSLLVEGLVMWWAVRAIRATATDH